MLPIIHWQIELFYEHLHIIFCWSKHWGYSFSCEMAVEWQIYLQPDCIFCHSDGCKKVKKAYYWTIKPLSKLEFGGGEIVIKTVEAKNKIIISFYGSRDRTFVIVKPSSNQVVWKVTQHTLNYRAIWMLVRSSGSILKFHTEQVCWLMRYLSKTREPWRWHTYWKSQQHTSNKCITKLLSWLTVLYQLRRILHMP